MSPPTKQLGKLSIGGNMSVTRFQASTVRPRKYNDDDKSDDNDYNSDSDHDNDQQDDDDDNDASGEEHMSEDVNSKPLASTVRAASQVVYNLEGLAMPSRMRALAGLTGKYDVVYCRESPDVYEFQLSERPRVQIRPNKLQCNCSEFESRLDLACRHIYWLVDQLYHCIQPRTPSHQVPLSSEGHSPDLPPIDKLLGENLMAVAEKLDWQYVPNVVSPRSSPDRDGLSREDKVRDIMSAFNECTFPEEFRLDLAETTGEPRTPEQCVVQGDFEATMFRLSVHDDNVYTSLRKAMPTGACAAIYFDKVQKRLRKIFAAFDLYRETGQLSADGTWMEVRHVVQLLRQLVERIRVNISLRIPYGLKGAAPYGLKGAAGALVALLQEICSRNIDAFEGNRWGRVSQHGEDEDDRNLYDQLIGQPKFQGYFVLDVLEELPPNLLRHYVSNLNEILSKIEINRASEPYIRKLKGLIHDAENGSNTSRPKRPATDPSGGNQKRAK
ncbi:hypothetical protein V8E54_006794 [Elaphomyces granulatus]